MKIISWNIACLPDWSNLFGDPKARSKNLINKIRKINPDIFCLQEVFSKYIRRNLWASFTKNYYIVMSRKTYLWSNGGLFIASKYPIIESHYHIFNKSAGEDTLAEKGFIHILVKNNDKYISIINTHLNAAPVFNYSGSKKIRQHQLYDILLYISQINKADYNFICGDLNEDIDSSIIKLLFTVLSKNNNFMIKNKKKLRTFENKQYDYIIFYGNNEIKGKYLINENDILSDHAILEYDVKNLE